MSEVARALVILGFLALALGVAGISKGHRNRVRRNSIHTESLRPWPAVVVFTSTECEACGPVWGTVVEHIPADLARRVVYQDDAELFRSAGIERVPTVVVVDGDGAPTSVIEGQVGGRQIKRAGRRAGSIDP